MGTHERMTEPGNVPDLIGRTEESASAWMRGDLDRYLALTKHAQGFTLLAPIGGAPTRHENRGQELATFTSNFQGGEATLEQVEAHAWGDTVVLVMIERQHGRVGDLPDQDGRCASLTCTGVTVPTGCWCTATRIRWSRRSIWLSCQR